MHRYRRLINQTELKYDSTLRLYLTHANPLSSHKPNFLPDVTTFKLQQLSSIQYMFTYIMVFLEQSRKFSSRFGHLLKKFGRIQIPNFQLYY